MDETLGDWRLQVAMRLAKDVPAAFPDGPSHKAGAPIHLVTSTRGTDNQPVGFVTPSSIALALNIAMNASIQATSLNSKIIFRTVSTPEGKGKAVGYETAAPLFDYFEACMIAVTFSFQALETFTNWIIADKVQSTFTITRDKGEETLTVPELERRLATEEKLHMVLPSLMGINSPKGKKVWEYFRKLKQARNSIAHLKSPDQYPNRSPSSTIDKDSLYFIFLNNQMIFYPKAAIAMIKYFYPRSEDVPRWLEKPIEFAKEK